MRVAIDTGGTFTDCLFLRDGRLEILKLPSTPGNPAKAIANALAEIRSRTSRDEWTELDLLCGTTVGTNALLERRGGRVALVTTAGFEDVLEIGRQARPRLYDFFVERPEPLVPRERRIGMAERVGADGKIVARPSGEEISRIVKRVRASRAESVAVCFLFSFLRPEHERILARRLRAEGYSVSVSHEILPEFREFERTSTTVMNAYLAPVMSRYLEEIERDAERAMGANGNARRRGARVRVMQSNGGILSARVAAREPVRTILSGPAGGALGAKQIAAGAGYERVISFDMGGTSTDVSLIEDGGDGGGALSTTNESIVAGLPVAVPMMEIHTVGAGGGSIARFDRAGALRVGPESAGADPGPICYGRGELPTVTDAHLILGRLGSEGLLGGGFRLDEKRTREYMRRAIRGARAVRSVEQFAQGILDVVEATMERAIRVISIERGRDPRDYTLAAFGGAGGLHACSLAASLGIPRVLVPTFPGALSALGILRADVVKDLSQSVLARASSRGDTLRSLERAFARIEREGLRDMRGEGFQRRHVRIERFFDMRYVGQAYELTIPAGGEFLKAFHREHERRYGYADPARAVEIVNVRARFTGRTATIDWPKQRLESAGAQAAVVAHRRVQFAGETRATAIYVREKLRAGNRVAGPAIISEYSATTVVPPGWSARVDAFENLVLASGRRGRGKLRHGEEQ
ncbi:MAG TPA: hydantoinase/oxoprolinase family protein [Candidatus Acidoferrales bacterium]|nr:hydantoinase/oxoprolinase family protein [Candidatus Acidoferrales bacterium]